ncbi:unnamed protein product [Thlaspi arvense]|uniref:Transposase n=1 Tax=Thlaspi arvense TaxID=13288 RepID=A0AAU9RQ64_THLAR|nr:unnamed protein product [Thlaspi arvense]
MRGGSNVGQDNMRNVKRIHWCIGFYFYRGYLETQKRLENCFRLRGVSLQNEQPNFVADHE